MAVYRCEVKRISRGAARPQSAVAAAAYRTAQRLNDERTGKVHDYRRRLHGLAYREMLAMPGAPVWATDRESLWNAAERAENRKNSVTAREALVSLPYELNEAQRIELARGFAQGLVQRYGVAADLAIHHPSRKGDDRNHHAHILFTTRRMGGDGLTEKTRELDDRVTGPREIEAIREMWERHQNLALERAGIQERVSRLSNAERGVDREPQAKLGGQLTAAERRGASPRLVDTWQEVARRRALTKDVNRADGDKRHRLERQALAERYARQASLREAAHSPMRRNMAAQAEQRRLEREERIAREKLPGGLIHGGLQATERAKERGTEMIAAAITRETTEVQLGQQQKRQAEKDEAQRIDEGRQRQAETKLALAWLKAQRAPTKQPSPSADVRAQERERQRELRARREQERELRRALQHGRGRARKRDRSEPD